MAHTTAGSDTINRAATVAAVNTYIYTDQPIASRGILKFIDVYMAGAGNLKVKVFRDDGSNYVFVGESASLTVDAGLNSSLPVWLVVEKGDFIGFKLGDGTMDATGTGGGAVYQAGDISTTTAKGDWSALTHVYSIRGYIFSKSGAIPA